MVEGDEAAVEADQSKWFIAQVDEDKRERVRRECARVRLLVRVVVSYSHWEYETRGADPCDK
jgi:hypothetical protein